MNTFTKLHYQYTHIYTYILHTHTHTHTHTYIYIHVWNHETMSPSSYHDNAFVATNALGHMMYGFTLLISITVTNDNGKYTYAYIHICHVMYMNTSKMQS